MADNNDNSLIILFGSQTGNAEELAEETKKLADKAGLNSHVIDMDEFSAELFPQHKRILIITSTWGEGEMPDNAEDLWGDVCSTAPSMTGSHFSVCAIGDTSYDEFCKAGLDWDNKLQELGANRTTEIQLCDVDYEPEWQEWVDKAIPAMVALEIPLEAVTEAEEEPAAEVIVEKEKVEKSSGKSDWSAKNPYNSTITECYVLNGEGSKKETRHIVFDLGDSGLDYRVGDALGVVPQNPPHIVDEILELQGWDRDQMVTTHKGERTLYDALKKDYEVHMANKTPPAVATIKEKAPNTKMRIDSGVRKVEACVEAPTVTPSRIVTISIIEVRAVSANRSVTIDSLRRLPKNNIPSSGSAAGVMNVVSKSPMIGNSTFSVLETARGGFIRITLSLLLVSNLMIGGWITGTRAMYE